MKTLALMLLCSIARADGLGGSVPPGTLGNPISPSSLSTTGQVTVGSTLTVLGSAFSVGGSSFSVTGGSATVAYGLTANRVTVGAAQLQTTGVAINSAATPATQGLSSSGTSTILKANTGGTVYLQDAAGNTLASFALASNAIGAAGVPTTITGSPTIVGTLAVSTSGANQNAISVDSNNDFHVGGTAFGFEQVIGTATLSNTSTYQFTNLSSSYSYRIEFDGILGAGSSAPQEILQFNTDTTNCTYQQTGRSNSTTVATNGSATTGCYIGVLQTGENAGDTLKFNAEFSSISPSSTTVVLTDLSSGLVAGNGWMTINGCQCPAASTLSTVTVKSSGNGTLTGRLVLWKKQIAYP